MENVDEANTCQNSSGLDSVPESSQSGQQTFSDDKSKVQLSDMSSPRGASPGVAKRVLTPQPPDADEQPSKNDQSTGDNVINDLTQRFAENLLDNSSKSLPKTDYVSINQKLEEKRKQELAERLAQSELVSPHVPAVHTSASYSQLPNESPVNGGASADVLLNGSGQSTHSATTNNTHNSTPIPASAMMDVASLTISKPAFSTSSPLNSNTMWENSNGGTAGKTVDGGDAEELDLITAMSGEPAPNTLPLVADGLSDGDISSESDVDDNDGEILNIVSQVIFFPTLS